MIDFSFCAQLFLCFLCWFYLLLHLTSVLLINPFSSKMFTLQDLWHSHTGFPIILLFVLEILSFTLSCTDVQQVYNIFDSSLQPFYSTWMLDQHDLMLMTLPLFQSSVQASLWTPNQHLDARWLLADIKSTRWSFVCHSSLWSRECCCVYIHVEALLSASACWTFCTDDYQSFLHYWNQMYQLITNFNP